MRLAVFSDIHGNLTAFETLLADLASVGEVDRLWCLGDLAALGPQAGATVQRVRALVDHYGEEKFQVIGGNADRYLITGERLAMPSVKEAESLPQRVAALKGRDAALNWDTEQLTWEDYEFMAKRLGRELHLNVKGYGTVIGVHAVPGDDEGQGLRPDSPQEEARDALLDREGRLALVGHTHHQFDRDLGTWRVINPGSVGMSFGRPGVVEWALLTFDERGGLTVDLRAIPYDVEAAIGAANATGHPNVAMVTQRLRQGA